MQLAWQTGLHPVEIGSKPIRNSKTNMRYTTRFNNGYWKVLDLHEYRDVGIFGLHKLALEACDAFNLDEAAQTARKVIAQAQA
jgi:hypothetical protein